MLTATQLNAADTQMVGLTNHYISISRKESFEQELSELDWSDDLAQNRVLLDSFIKSFEDMSKSKAGFPDPQLEQRLDLVQDLTNELTLPMVAKNILSNPINDKWFERGKKGILAGSPTSAYLIWEQCHFRGHTQLKEVFKFELDLAIQVTRHPDFTEGIRAIIIEKDNQPDWKYPEIDNMPRQWIEEHLEPAWDKNPLEDLTI